MIEGRVIRGVDLSSPAFIKSFGRLKTDKLKQEVAATLRNLLLADVDTLPRKLHCHQLTDKLVPSRIDPKKKINSWTLHVTADDRFKASFTWEGGVAYFRLVDEHDVIDKNP